LHVIKHKAWVGKEKNEGGFLFYILSFDKLSSKSVKNFKTSLKTKITSILKRQ